MPGSHEVEDVNSVAVGETRRRGTSTTESATTGCPRRRTGETRVRVHGYSDCAEADRRGIFKILYASRLLP